MSKSSHRTALRLAGLGAGLALLLGACGEAGRPKASSSRAP